MSGKLKVAGTWKSVPAVYTKVSGAWRTVSKGYVNVGGVWKLWFLATITDSFTRTTSAGTLGNTDTGNTWSILRGAWYAASGYATDNTALILRVSPVAGILKAATAALEVILDLLNPFTAMYVALVLLASAFIYAINDMYGLKNAFNAVANFFIGLIEFLVNTFDAFEFLCGQKFHV
jgi:hypothetical protein